ncbi:organic cation transporter protein [Orussus abietinus]|uniref:organic cation transporter protein n=1 Tax=Orussus abietinus TaxID=222816 RepID=UPI000625C7D2|nr:organic cation transporter protein [Orussus abietinus]XP_023288432.1 organic cation transporter protein [Orussus abietinus]
MASADQDLEELMSHLGEFGKYQAWQFSLHILGALTAGLHMMSLTTVAAVPPHRCISDLANATITWRDGAASLSDLDGTSRVIEQTCSYLDLDNRSLDCDSWSYDRTYFQSSRGMEWNFVCSRRWMGAVAQATYMFGVFVGAVTLGSMADKYGRKTIFYASAVGQLILGVGVALLTEYYSFLVIRFLYGVFGSAGAYITGFVLTMELVGASRRSACGVAFQASFAMGFMLVAAWGAFVEDRMLLQIIYGLHSALLIGHWWLMDESPRWLWIQGRVKEATEIVQKGVRMNGDSSKIDIARYVSRNASRQASKVERTYTAADLFKTPNLRKKSLNVCLNWFANSIVYYGLSLNTGNLVGNPFLMLFLIGMVELPSYVLTSLLMDRTGRRALISCYMLLGGFCCICAASVPSSFPGARVITITVVMVGKACIASSFGIIYNYTAELFPTVLRNTALGIGSMCARLSGALTPLIMLLDSFDPKVPATTFGFIALVSGFLSLYLPETLNQPMPETLEDGESFGKGDTCFSRKSKRAYSITMRQVDDEDLKKAESP